MDTGIAASGRTSNSPGGTGPGRPRPWHIADWQSAPGPWSEADVYNGEAMDGREWEEGWDTADGGTGEQWKTLRDVGLASPPIGKLCGLLCEPMTVQEDIEPRRVRARRPGSRVFDFGQNLCGGVRSPARRRMPGPRYGFSERIDAAGHVDQSDLRSARATDRYTFAGKAGETWEAAVHLPWFSLL